VYGALAQLGYKPGEIEPLVDAMDAARPVADLVREALGALRKR
jgi:Holliday junction resolvasome RuvABC DNA-binding subunit